MNSKSKTSYSAFKNLTDQEKENFSTVINNLNEELQNQCKHSKIKKITISASEQRENDKLVANLISDSQKNIFDKKEFKLNNKKVMKTDIYNFFKSNKSIKKNDEIVEFQCLVCNTVCSEPFKNSSNLTTHLKLHNTETDKRLKDYFDNKKKSTKKLVFLEKNYKLINYLFLLIYFILIFKESMKTL